MESVTMLSNAEWLDSLELRRRMTRNECLHRAAARMREHREHVSWIYVFAWAGMPL